MNVAATLAASAAAIAILAGAMSRRLSLAPGWRDQYGFSLVAFSAAAYAICNLATTLGLPDGVVTAASRLQVASGVLHLAAWFRYCDAFEGRRPTAATVRAGRALVALAALALVPGVVFTPLVVTHAAPAFRTVYRDAVPTPFGYAVLAVVFASAVTLPWRFARAWRAGVRYAGVHAAAILALVVFGMNDALATTGRFPTPYLLDTGFVLPIVAVYWTITARFVDNARALHSMRAKLQDAVEARTRELAEAQSALHQTEKLAALGRFANGVAHEVSSPASVVSANLRCLENTLPPGAVPADAREALAEARASMSRINDLVRKLVDAGRIASAPTGGTTAVADVVRGAVASAESRAAGRVEIACAVPDGLYVRAAAEGVAEVLGHLLANASDAVPEGRTGRVEARAERRGGIVRITIADDGLGMAPDVLRRAFDPFFTTKPQGRGCGLGLAVARGLVEGSGGALWLESAPGRGTRAILELPVAKELPRATPVPPSQRC
jgi:signal transduction histidine kinase